MVCPLPDTPLAPVVGLVTRLRQAGLTFTAEKKKKSSKLEGMTFVLTGTMPDLTREDLDGAGWPLSRAPYLLETSRPNIFAIGDVRGGNIKRVASAVGEGSIAIAFVHQVLRD